MKANRVSTAAFVFSAVLGAATIPQQSPWGFFVLADTGQPQKQPRELKLDPKIPAAKPAQYRAVREPREWRNPWLDVNDRGFELRSRSSPERKLVSLEDLRRVLTELPLSDWPYGRVVVVQYPSIGAASPEWWRAAKENIDGARKVLKALGADDWGWPA